MIQVRIVSPQGSLLYAAAELTRYDLQNLQSHVRELRGKGSAAPSTRVELDIDHMLDASSDEGVSAFVSRLVAGGVRVSWSGRSRAMMRPTTAGAERGH
jgi:hypothetical protein